MGGRHNGETLHKDTHSTDFTGNWFFYKENKNHFKHASTNFFLHNMHATECYNACYNMLLTDINFKVCSLASTKY